MEKAYLAMKKSGTGSLVLGIIILAVGLAAGILSTTKALELLMARYPRATYLVILGFMLASLPTLFPGLPKAGEWLPCLTCLLAGFGIIYKVSRL